MEDFSKRMKISEYILLREVGEEAVLLNLNTQQYYSLNPSGMRMLQVLNTSASMEQALSSLSEEYAVDPVLLRNDLRELLELLLKHGLIEIV